MHVSTLRKFDRRERDLTSKMSNIVVFFALVLLCLSTVVAFRPVGMRALGLRTPMQRSMSEQPPMEEFEDPKLFDMNKRVRLGRSRDQDGKSNIWSIEPRMEVEEGGEAAAEGGNGTKKNLLIVGAVIGAALISLPLFQAFSTLVPNPADF